MPDMTLREALLKAAIAEMKRTLESRSSTPADHALHNSGRLGDRPDGSIEVELDFVPDMGFHGPVKQGQWTDEDGKKYLMESLSLTRPTSVRMSFTNHARASLSLRAEDGGWAAAELDPGQQETLDRYATEAAFWLTGTANGALTYVDEDPYDYPEDGGDRESIIIDDIQAEVRRSLGAEAFACEHLARRTGPDGVPNAAYLDAARAVRTAAAKVARANQYPGLGEARRHHEKEAFRRGTEDFMLERDFRHPVMEWPLMDDSLLEDLCGFLDREPDTEEIEWAYGNLELDLEAPDGVPNGIHDFTVDGDDSRVFHGIVVEEGKFDPHMSAHAVYLAQVARHGRAQLAPMYIRLLEWRWLDLYHGRFQVLVGS